MTLSSSIDTLTTAIERLEAIRAALPVVSYTTREANSALAFEIIALNSLLDQLNALYEETRDRELDCAFERA